VDPDRWMWLARTPAACGPCRCLAHPSTGTVDNHQGRVPTGAPFVSVLAAGRRPADPADSDPCPPEDTGAEQVMHQMTRPSAARPVWSSERAAPAGAGKGGPARARAGRGPRARVRQSGAGHRAVTRTRPSAPAQGRRDHGGPSVRSGAALFTGQQPGCYPDQLADSRWDPVAVLGRPDPAVELGNEPQPASELVHANEPGQPPATRLAGRSAPRPRPGRPPRGRTPTTS